MKKLRSLSIYHPEALCIRNRKTSWGHAYWRGVAVRKQKEHYNRQLGGMMTLLVPLIPVAEDQIPYHEAAPAKPSVH